MRTLGAMTLEMLAKSALHQAIKKLQSTSRYLLWSNDPVYTGVKAKHGTSMCGWAGTSWQDPMCTLKVTDGYIRCPACRKHDRAKNKEDLSIRNGATNAVVIPIWMKHGVPRFLVHKRASTMIGGGKLAFISGIIDGANTAATTALLELSQEYCSVEPLRHPGEQLQFVGISGTAAVFVAFVDGPGPVERTPHGEVDAEFGHCFLSEEQIRDCPDFWHVALKNLDLISNLKV